MQAKEEEKRSRGLGISWGYLGDSLGRAWGYLGAILGLSWQRIPFIANLPAKKMKTDAFVGKK